MFIAIYLKRTVKMKRQIKLNEQQLHDFITYSVRRILREGYGNLPTYELELDPENDEALAQSIEKQYNKYNDVSVEALDSIWPLYIEVSYDYDAPGDPGYGGSLTLVDWKLEEGQNVPMEIRDFLNSAINDYVFETGKDYVKDEIISDIDNYEPDFELDEGNVRDDYGNRMKDIFPDTRLDQEGEFANKIYSLIADLDDEIEEVNQMVSRGEDVDYNTQEYYSLVVKARDILDELAHFRNEDI